MTGLSGERLVLGKQSPWTGLDPSSYIFDELADDGIVEECDWGPLDALDRTPCLRRWYCAVSCKLHGSSEVLQYEHTSRWYSSCSCLRVSSMKIC